MTISNQKGGVKPKTTTAITMAASLEAVLKKTPLVDGPQANATSGQCEYTGLAAGPISNRTRTARKPVRGREIIVNPPETPFWIWCPQSEIWLVLKVEGLWI